MGEEFRRSERLRLLAASSFDPLVLMNYFNYFTEIEDTFVRRRGRHVLLSPLDWALIENWKEKGVPLHIALSGIERAFDSYQAKPRKRSVKSLLYCQEEVEAQYAEWLESQVGAQAEDGANDNGHAALAPETEASLPFPRADILAHLRNARAKILHVCEERRKARPDQLCDGLSRAAAQIEELEKDFARARRPQAEQLEAALTNLERMLNGLLLSSLTKAELETARSATAAELEPYRSRMERETYEQTFDNLLLKRLRDRYDLPRLSLFYL